MHWDYALLLAFFGTAVPLLGRRRVRRLLAGPETTQAERLRLYASTMAFQWLAAAAILWRTGVHGMSAADLGLAAPRPILVALVSCLLFLLVLGNQLASLRLMGMRPDPLQGVLPQLALRVFPQDAVERLVFFGVVVTVATCEELIYRGFMQSLFAQFSHSVWIGMVGSAILFSIAHLYQGRRGLLATLVVGMLFGVARLATGSLIPGVVAHFTADLIAGFFLPTRLQKLAGTSPVVAKEPMA